MFLCPDNDDSKLVVTTNGLIAEEGTQDFVNAIHEQFHFLSHIAIDAENDIGVCSNLSRRVVFIYPFYYQHLQETGYLLMMWMGPRDPIVSVDSFKWVLPSDVVEHDIRMSVPVYCYELSLESWILFCNPKDILVRLINFYVMTCRAEEHTSFLDGTKYLRFMCYKDRDDSNDPNGQPSNPYAYAYQRLQSLMIPQHAKIAKNCPPENLLCEVSFSEISYFMTIPKQEFVSKKILIDNITSID